MAERAVDDAADGSPALHWWVCELQQPRVQLPAKASSCLPSHSWNAEHYLFQG